LVPDVPDELALPVFMSHHSPLMRGIFRKRRELLLDRVVAVIQPANILIRTSIWASLKQRALLTHGVVYIPALL
jgi:hypothetical protein